MDLDVTTGMNEKPTQNETIAHADFNILSALSVFVLNPKGYTYTRKKCSLILALVTATLNQISYHINIWDYFQAFKIDHRQA